MRPAILIIVLVAIGAPGCMKRQQLNATCTWPPDPPRRLNLAAAADQAHLAYDAQLAEELGIRYGDSSRGRKALEQLGSDRAACTEKLVAHIKSIHGVSRIDVLGARDRRDLRVDALTVFLPVALMFALMSDFLVARVFRRFTAEERWARITALIVTGFVAGVVLLQLGEMWALPVEMIRLGDTHMSDRAFRLPWVQHRLAIFCAAVGVFSITAFRRSRDETLKRRER